MNLENFKPDWHIIQVPHFKPILQLMAPASTILP